MEAKCHDDYKIEGEESTDYPQRHRKEDALEDE